MRLRQGLQNAARELVFVLDALVGVGDRAEHDHRLFFGGWPFFELLTGQLDGVGFDVDVAAPIIARLVDEAAGEGGVAVDAAELAAGIGVDHVIGVRQAGGDEDGFGLAFDDSHKDSGGRD